MGKLCKVINGKKIMFTPLNSKTLQLETTGVITDISYSKDIDRDITSITIADDYRITRHGSIKVPFLDREVVYEINHITQTGPKKFLLLTHLKNRTSIYLLPALGLLPISRAGSKLDIATRHELSRYCAKTYLINAYLDSKNLRILQLVYRFSNHSTYKILEECIVEHPGFISVVDGYKNDDYVSFRLEIPKEYQKDVYTFLRGHYSGLSPELKREIIKFHGAGKKSRLYQVLTKSEELRKSIEEDLDVRLGDEQELDSIPDKELEFTELIPEI